MGFTVLLNRAKMRSRNYTGTDRSPAASLVQRRRDSTYSKPFLYKNKPQKTILFLIRLYGLRKKQKTKCGGCPCRERRCGENRPKKFPYQFYAEEFFFFCSHPFLYTDFYG